jgi:hypothetical protein
MNITFTRPLVVSMPRRTRQGGRGKEYRTKAATVRAALIWTIVLFVPAAEVTLRIFNISAPVFTNVDPDLGGVHTPLVEGWYQTEGRSYVTINSHGMRDREHTLEKPANCVRVAVLGDSYPEAMQFPPDASVCVRLEEELKRCRAFQGKTVEVLNFGVGGYGTAQELLCLRKSVWQFSPDIILLAFSPGTDVKDNSKKLSNGGLRPYYLLNGNGLVLDNSFRELSGYKLRKHKLANLVYSAINKSYLLQLINSMKNSMGVEEPEGNENAAFREVRLDDLVRTEPRDAAWAEAWTITERLLLAMRDEVKAHGAQFLVFTISGDSQVHPDPNVRAEMAAKLKTKDLYYAERRLSRVLEQANVPILNLAPEFMKYPEAVKGYLHGFRKQGSLGRGHWNESAHRLAGKLIADFVCQHSSGPGSSGSAK